MKTADLCRQNGWKVGTILEGDEGRGTDRIEITAIGEQAVLAKSVDGSWSVEHLWDVGSREWKEVRDEEHLPKLSDLMGLLEHDPIDIGG